MERLLIPYTVIIRGIGVWNLLVEEFVLEMFDGKGGLRVYKRKRDAEFIAEKKDSSETSRGKILKILISNAEKARDMGVSVHPDLSVAARKPRKGERGWVVVQSNEIIDHKYGSIFEILSKD